MAGGRSADSGIQLDSSVRGSEGSTKASPQDSRESSAVCHTHRDTQTHTCMHSHANTHHQTRTLADLFPLRMVQAPALPVRSEQHCGQVHTCHCTIHCVELLWCKVYPSSTSCPELSKARQEAFDTFRRDYADNDAIEHQKRTLKAKLAPPAFHSLHLRSRHAVLTPLCCRYAEAKSLGERVNTSRMMISERAAMCDGVASG